MFLPALCVSILCMNTSLIIISMYYQDSNKLKVSVIEYNIVIFYYKDRIFDKIFLDRLNLVNK